MEKITAVFEKPIFSKCFDIKNVQPPELLPHLLEELPKIDVDHTGPLKEAIGRVGPLLQELKDSLPPKMSQGEGSGPNPFEAMGRFQERIKSSVEKLEDMAKDPKALLPSGCERAAFDCAVGEPKLARELGRLSAEFKEAAAALTALLGTALEDLKELGAALLSLAAALAAAARQVASDLPALLDAFGAKGGDGEGGGGLSESELGAKLAALAAGGELKALADRLGPSAELVERAARGLAGDFLARLAALVGGLAKMAEELPGQVRALFDPGCCARMFVKVPGQLRGLLDEVGAAAGEADLQSLPPALDEIGASLKTLNAEALTKPAEPLRALHSALALAGKMLSATAAL